MRVPAPRSAIKRRPGATKGTLTRPAILADSPGRPPYPASFWRSIRVHLFRQADQVSDGHECAGADESRQADGEQDPEKFDLLVAEAEAVHCLSAKLQLLLAAQRDNAVLKRKKGGQRGA